MKSPFIARRRIVEKEQWGQVFVDLVEGKGRMVKILMRLAGSRISTSLPAARASGLRQWIHRFGPLTSEKE
jgi:hypothetical protein